MSGILLVELFSQLKDLLCNKIMDLAGQKYSINHLQWPPVNQCISLSPSFSLCLFLLLFSTPSQALLCEYPREPSQVTAVRQVEFPGWGVSGIPCLLSLLWHLSPSGVTPAPPPSHCRRSTAPTTHCHPSLSSSSLPVLPCCQTSLWLFMLLFGSYLLHLSLSLMIVH